MTTAVTARLPTPASAGIGQGLGLRPEYYHEILTTLPDIDWFEAISENYMGFGTSESGGVRGGGLSAGGKPLHHLERVREHYPIALHGVSLSIGGSHPIDSRYLRELRALCERIEPLWVSDHLCWTRTGAHQFHDLLPLPYTDATIDHLAERIDQVQNALGRQLLLENVSSYLTWRPDEMSEWEFLAEVSRRADCLILLDLNNVIVSSHNHGFDPLTYLDAMPAERVWQHHLAGHIRQEVSGGELCIDTHDQPVPDAVWTLYDAARKRFGDVATMIERDDNFPPWSELMQEYAELRRRSGRPLADAAHKDQTADHGGLRA
ncbi:MULTISPECIES: DUF692 domain-containing protein [unclassified Cobetia]|uniref:MNIO family bufferin maturase n=1 Tax=unclassified Cobetia TaxID=2609414 RepID=UPI002097420A|nr:MULTISPECIES: DUF692 domain-containing protein [unclassified Cobetia]MCO7232465.1 DUF692 domain-containing protein [Cobetia sp. Dlab-2-AX]MCO7235739.1 DUF692 domain-containing protein [Cobetia sp. Dlab-2-U]